MPKKSKTTRKVIHWTKLIYHLAALFQELVPKLTRGMEYEICLLFRFRKIRERAYSKTRKWSALLDRICALDTKMYRGY